MLFLLPQSMKTTAQSQIVKRPPVVVVLGHVDHGKSTLLDYIRKTNIVETEAGGITQHTAAYEVEYITRDNTKEKITFIDTPGHEAFGAQRERGASIADIAILVVSAEDGVKKQTLEAHTAITNQNIPYIVAINKTDSPKANIEKTISSLTEHGIYLEGRGGNISYVPISAKTGDGVDQLIDMILLLAEVQEFTADLSQPAEGYVVESHRNPKRGICATIIIKNGQLTKGSFVATHESASPVRSLEINGTPLAGNALPCAPLTIVGWSSLPKIGSTFHTYKTKKEAESHVAEEKSSYEKVVLEESADQAVLPLIIKADVVGSLDALHHEINKVKHDSVIIKILKEDVGAISENDIKSAGGDTRTIVIGFNVSVENSVPELAERLGVRVHTDNIIYKIAEWLETIIAERIPRTMVEETRGKLKVLKLFSQTKNKQVVGGRVEEGIIKLGDKIRVVRRDMPIGTGRVTELQQMKSNVPEVSTSTECGLKVETTVDVSAGDHLISYSMVEKQV